MSPELAEAERMAAIQRSQGVGLENEGKRLANLHKTYGPLMDQMEQAGRTPEEIADYLTKRGIPTVPQDVRERKIVYDAKGRAVSYTTKGPIETNKETDLPINYDEVRSPVTVTPTGGQPITGIVSEGKKLDTLVGVQESGARMQQTEENRKRQQANDDRDYELRREKFKLDVQQEERMKEEAKRRYEGKDPDTYKKRTDDLDKARRAVNDLRAEHDGLTSIPEADRTEAQRQKLVEIGAKERNALMYYEEILKRLQNGQ